MSAESVVEQLNIRSRLNTSPILPLGLSGRLRPYVSTRLALQFSIVFFCLGSTAAQSQSHELNIRRAVCELECADLKLSLLYAGLIDGLDAREIIEISDEGFYLAIRTCSRSSEQKREEGEVDELQAGVEFALAVFPQTATFFDPCE